VLGQKIDDEKLLKRLKATPMGNSEIAFLIKKIRRLSRKTPLESFIFHFEESAIADWQKEMSCIQDAFLVIHEENERRQIQNRDKRAEETRRRKELEDKRRAEKPPPRICPKCQQLKDSDAFWGSDKQSRDRTKWCKMCLNELRDGSPIWS